LARMGKRPEWVSPCLPPRTPLLGALGLLVGASAGEEASRGLSACETHRQAGPRRLARAAAWPADPRRDGQRRGLSLTPAEKVRAESLAVEGERL